jgi:hypothetical protein
MKSEHHIHLTPQSIFCWAVPSDITFREVAFCEAHGTPVVYATFDDEQEVDTVLTIGLVVRTDALPWPTGVQPAPEHHLIGEARSDEGGLRSVAMYLMDTRPMTEEEKAEARDQRLVMQGREELAQILHQIFDEQEG